MRVSEIILILERQLLEGSVWSLHSGGHPLIKHLRFHDGRHLEEIILVAWCYPLLLDADLLPQFVLVAESGHQRTSSLPVKGLHFPR